MSDTIKTSILDGLLADPQVVEALKEIVLTIIRAHLPAANAAVLVADLYAVRDAVTTWMVSPLAQPEPSSVINSADLPEVLK